MSWRVGLLMTRAFEFNGASEVKVKRLIALSFLNTLGVSCLLLVVPTHSGETETGSSGAAVSIAHATHRRYMVRGS